MTQKQKQRNVKALERIESQLKAGVKPEKANGKTTTKQVPLTDADVKRLNKEAETLRSRT